MEFAHIVEEAVAAQYDRFSVRLDRNALGETFEVPSDILRKVGEKLYARKSSASEALTGIQQERGSLLDTRRIHRLLP